MWQRKSKTPSSSSKVSKAAKFSKSLEQTQSSVGRFYAPEYEIEDIRSSEVVSAKKPHWWDDDYVPLPDESHQVKVRTLGAIVKPTRSQAQASSQVQTQGPASPQEPTSVQAYAQDAGQTSSQGADELNFIVYVRGNSRYQSELQAAKARKQQRLQQIQQAQLSQQGLDPTSQQGPAQLELSQQEPEQQKSVLDVANRGNAAAQTEEVVAELHDALQDERLVEAKALVKNTSYQERLKRHQKRKQPEALHDLSLEPGSYAEFVAKYRAKMQGTVVPDSYAEQVKFMQQVAAERAWQAVQDKNQAQGQAAALGANSAQTTPQVQAATLAQAATLGHAATSVPAQASSLSPAQILELKKREQRWEESGLTRLEAAEFGGHSLSKIGGVTDSTLEQVAQANLQEQAAHTAPQRESARDIIKRKMAALRLHSEAQKLVRQAQMRKGDMDLADNIENANAEASGGEIEDTLNLSGRWWKQRRDLDLGSNLASATASASSRSRMGARAISRFNSAHSSSTLYGGATNYVPASAMDYAPESAIGAPTDSARETITIDLAADKNSGLQAGRQGAWKLPGEQGAWGRPEEQGDLGQRARGRRKAQGQGGIKAASRSSAPVQPVALDADEASASFGNYFDYGRKVAAKDADSMTSSFGNYHEGEQRLEEAESADEVVSSFGSCFDPPAITGKRKGSQRSGTARLGTKFSGFRTQRTQRTQSSSRQLQAHSADESVASFGDVLTSSCSHVGSSSISSSSSSSNANSGLKREWGQYKRDKRGSRTVVKDAESTVASFSSIGSSNRDRGGLGARDSNFEVETVAAHQAETTEIGKTAESVGAAGAVKGGKTGKGRMTGKAQAELPEDVQAFNAMVQMLTRREHSQVEIRQKLKERFSAEAIEIALKRCVDSGYQSDARHAEMLVRHMEFSGYGPQKLWVEAKRKGADEDEIKCLALEVDWDSLAYKVLTGRYSAEQMQDYTTRNKALAFLARRGFSASSGYAALQRLQNCAENE